MMNATKSWRYSHTQLAMWKRCKRLYYNAYVLGKKEPTTPNMAAGTWLAQEPIERWEASGRQLVDIDLWYESVWANFLAEFDGDNSYDSPVFTLDLAKRILAAYKANPVQGKVVEIEHTYEKKFPGGYLYTSRPDFVVERDAWTELGNGETHHTIVTTWDIKLKTFNQARAGDTFYAKAELSAFDDQCLGQAILSGADAFGQIIFLVGKKDATLVGPFYLEQPVDPVLAREWKRETLAEIHNIADWRANLEPGSHDPELNIPWPKNTNACHDFSKDCHNLAACNFGFEVKRD